jgi:2-dehydro-3-deoxyphosphogluconate aldolase / (4S)-4-hydroxy-2-oxoglutarate aldolase
MKLPQAIVDGRLIPVARGLDRSTASRMVTALEAGGIRVIEITVEGSGGLEAISALADGEALVGAGTITSVSQAERAVDAGAQFLVSPHFDQEMLVWASMRAVPFIPGALTPTEVAGAWSHRPPAIKIFPANLGGPGYISGLLGPFPDLATIPTGGITSDNAADFLAAGAVAVGVGGWLTSHDDYDEVARRARLLVAAISNAEPI